MMNNPADGHPDHFADRYWFWWLILTVVSFLSYEIFSLVTGKPQNTLSAWVWEHLRIHAGQSVTEWSAGDLLTFAAYISIFILWLPWHFWFAKFR